MSAVAVPTLSDRVDELERELDELKRTPQDTIGDTNTTIINSKGEVEPLITTLGIAEFLDTFEDEDMSAAWQQAPSVGGVGPVDDPAAPIWLPTVGKGLVLQGPPVGPLFPRRMALLVAPEYIESGDPTKPLLSYYQAILAVSTMQVAGAGALSFEYGLRVLDTSQFGIDPTLPFVGNASEGLDVHFRIEGEKLTIRWSGYGAGTSSTAVYKTNNKNFWLQVMVIAAPEGDQWRASVFDAPPGKWSSQPTADQALVSSTFNMGAAQHRMNAHSNLRMALWLKASGIPEAEIRALWELEKGAQVHSLRVMPASEIAHTNF